VFIIQLFVLYLFNFKNKDKMKTIKRIIKQVKENKNLKPYKVVRLSSGVICEHYSNGNIKVL
jgi:hypothetical protein